MQILRVAAHNHAAFEWIHHEHVGRDAGLSTAQLTVIRNVSNPAPPLSSPDPLTALQAAALAFTDASTKDIKVSDIVFNALSDELRSFMNGIDDELVQDLAVEAAAVVSTYNMVSRFLVSLDVAGISDEPVPWPVDHKEVLLSLFLEPRRLTLLPAHCPNPQHDPQFARNHADHLPHRTLACVFQLSFNQH